MSLADGRRFDGTSIALLPKVNHRVPTHTSRDTTPPEPNTVKTKRDSYVRTGYMQCSVKWYATERAANTWSFARRLTTIIPRSMSFQVVARS